VAVRRPAGPWLLLALLVALVSGLAGGVAGGLAVRLTTDDDGDEAPEASIPVERQVVLSEESAITDVVREAQDAVVTVISRVEPTPGASGFAVEETTVGSGVVVDERGFIVTNEHVVRGSVDLEVVLAGGERRAAVIVDDDSPFTDLAVLRVGGDELTALPFGDSDALVPGQRIIAIGNAPFDLGKTVTVGVVSAVHQTWPRNGVIMEDLVQTDAAINHGGSGGAVLNASGELVGLSTTVVRSTETGQAVEGVAFAISSNTIAPIARTMIESGSFPRAYVGIVHQDVTPELAALHGLDVQYGAFVVEVAADTPAKEAGMQEGDIITQMGDVQLGPDMPFLNALARLTADETVPFVVDREGQEITLEVNLGRR